MGLEYYLLLISFFVMETVVCITKIQLAKDLSVAKSIKQLAN
jgi:hypothetical protein